MSPRCLHGRAWAVQWSFGYAIQPLTPDKSEIRDLRYALDVEVHFKNASAHQMCLCEWTRHDVTREEDPTSLKKAKLEAAQREEPDTGPTVCQDRAIRSNQTVHTFRWKCVRSAMSKLNHKIWGLHWFLLHAKNDKVL